jgi:hypothetical protein
MPHAKNAQPEHLFQARLPPAALSADEISTGRHAIDTFLPFPPRPPAPHALSNKAFGAFLRLAQAMQDVRHRLNACNHNNGGDHGHDNAIVPHG